jgi:hypothetical protein
MIAPGDATRSPRLCARWGRCWALALAWACSVGLVVAASAFGASGLPPQAAATPAASGADVSSNWAGFVAVGPGSTATMASSTMSYSDVTGEWIEPKASCSSSQTSVAIWVGLGGYSINSQKLEQAGTSADCRSNGTASYYAWYELVPANAVDIKLEINPGDLITSAVVIDGANVLVQITDRTRGTRFTRRLPMQSPDRSSAEWIVEAPSECGSSVSCQQVALTDFGSVNFSRTYAIGNGIGGTITSPGWISTAIQLVPHSQRVFGRDAAAGLVGAGANPGGLAADGSGFSIEWRPVASTSG